MWFSLVCTLIDNDTCHHTGQNVVDSRGAAYSLAIRIQTTINHLCLPQHAISTSNNFFFRARAEKALRGMLLKQVTGNGERGTGNGERGTGNGERGTGNGERGTGNGERGTGNGERGTGNGERGTGNGERERERGTGNGERGTGNGERGTGNGSLGTGVLR